jgi:predicted nucleic acid-binding protein
MYLLDTNVVSEMRKIKSGRIDPRFRVWAERARPEAHYLSAVTILELEVGVLLMERRDPLQGASLRSWMRERVIAGFGERILAVDVAVSLRCATLHVPDPRPEIDAIIAATALVRGFTVVTRNVADFEPTGVSTFNPWQPS